MRGVRDKVARVPQMPTPQSASVHSLETVLAAVGKNKSAHFSATPGATNAA